MFLLNETIECMVFLDSQGPKVSPLVGYSVSFTLDSQAHSSQVLRFYEVSDEKNPQNYSR